MDTLKPTTLTLDEVQKLKKDEKNLESIDCFDDLLEELFRIRFPQIGEEQESYKKTLVDFKRKYSTGQQSERWIYYSRKKILVHMLPAEETFEIRTARNRYLITEEEQNRFRNSHIGICGLSVGNSVAHSIVLTGGSKKISLADPDTLALSNTNRIRTGITYLGKNKAEIAAEQLYEIDPDLEINIFSRGITESNLKEFIGNLDLVIDEMDDLRLKILLRIEAKKLHKPVLMATDNDDGALIDIERFDLEPGRAIFHGAMGDVANIDNLTIEDRVRISSQIVGKKYISDRMYKSLLSVGKEIPTWPQLGTAATVSGACIAFVARKILVGEKVDSRRYLLKLDEIIKNQVE